MVLNWWLSCTLPHVERLREGQKTEIPGKHGGIGEERLATNSPWMKFVKREWQPVSSLC